MLLVVSPAKTLDFETPAPKGLRLTRPAFAAEAAELATALKRFDASGLCQLMDISPALAELNIARFRDFSARPAASRERPAVLAFRGDTYLGMRAETFDAADMEFAQQHLRILSGLYGLLRPLDRIQPYRLEMGSVLANARGPDLYAFWGERIARTLARQARSLGTATLVNLASQEYFRAVDAAALGLRVVTPQFKERRGGTLKIVSFSAKRARGAMAAFAIRHRLAEPEALQRFDEDGYRFEPSLSGPDEWVFAR